MSRPGPTYPFSYKKPDPIHFVNRSIITKSDPLYKWVDHNPAQQLPTYNVEPTFNAFVGDKGLTK